MSGSVARPSPVRQQIVDSLMFMAPPSLPHLSRLLHSARIECETAAKEVDFAESIGREPSDELLSEAEAAVFKAYLALYAMRKDGRQS